MAVTIAEYYPRERRPSLIKILHRYIIHKCIESKQFASVIRGSGAVVVVRPKGKRVGSARGACTSLYYRRNRLARPPVVDSSSDVPCGVRLAVLNVREIRYSCVRVWVICVSKWCVCVFFRTAHVGHLTVTRATGTLIICLPVIRRPACSTLFPGYYLRL